MRYDSITSASSSEELYTAFFEALSSNSHLLKNDAPRFTVLATTHQILKLSGVAKKDIVGKGIFETFPSNPHDIGDTGENNLRASLMHVLHHKAPHQLPILRYDVANE